MKLLEFFGYIRLPDDFEGKDIDALEWYLKDRKQRESTTGVTVTRGDGLNWKEPMYKHMNRLYDMLIDSGKTRSGVFAIREFKNGEWVEIDF